MPEPPRDDSLMSRFDRRGLRRFRARDALWAVAVCAVLLVLLDGVSVRRAGEAMNPGIGRSIVLAVGRPAGWVADRLPFASRTHRLTAWLSPDEKLASVGGFSAAGTARTTAHGVPPVTPDSFDPATIGAHTTRRPLHTLLVTGDSMAMPLDVDLARRLAGSGVRVIRDAHVGSGISKSILVDWGKLSASQVAQDRPDAVVVFIGANDGFPMPGPGRRQVACCGVPWATVYASRVRQMMNTYRQGGRARVYWITLPAPREAKRVAVQRVVNAAIEVAAEPWRDQVRVIDTVPVFTPGNRYRDAMSVGGQQTIVREADGIHLDDAGANLLAGIVIGRLREDFSP